MRRRAAVRGARRRDVVRLVVGGHRRLGHGGDGVGAAAHAVGRSVLRRTGHFGAGAGHFGTGTGRSTARPGRFGRLRRRYPKTGLHVQQFLVETLRCVHGNVRNSGRFPS